MNAEQLQELIDDAADSLRELTEIISQYPDAAADFALNLDHAREVAEKFEQLEIEDGQGKSQFVINPGILTTKKIYESDGGWAVKWQAKHMDAPAYNYFPTRTEAEKFLREAGKQD